MSTQVKDSPRLERMDIARGFGILIVVLGHNEACSRGSVAFQIIYSFHVPLFFFISGFFHRFTPPLSSDIGKRARKLLLPYLLTGLGIVLIKAIFNPHTAVLMMMGLAWGAGGSGTPYSFLYWPPVWFLTSLFITQVSFSILHPFLLRAPTAARYISGAALLLLGIYYIHNWGEVYFPNSKMLSNETGLLWNLDLLPATLFFYWLGWECQNKAIIEKYLSFRSGVPALAIFLTLFVTYCTLNAKGGFAWVLDLNRREYGHAVFTTTGAILGIMTILATSEWMAKSLTYSARKAIANLGMQSLSVLIFHHFFQENMRQILSTLDMPDVLRCSMTWTAGVTAPLLLNSLIFQRFKILQTLYGNPSIPKE